MDFTSDVSRMSEYCANVLLRVKTDFVYKNMSGHWNPQLVEQHDGLYCICSGVMWAPSTGFIVEKGVVNKDVLKYFEKHFPNAAYT
jgi:hypothetical protein